MMTIMDEVAAEMTRAEDRYGPYASTHEGYGVLAEEVAEVFEAVRAGSLQATRREAIQVAAVAMRLAEACDQGYETAFGQRSVK